MNLPFPALSDIFASLVSSIHSGVLLDRAWTSLRILVIGYITGIFIAAVLNILAISTRRY